MDNWRTFICDKTNDSSLKTTNKGYSISWLEKSDALGAMLIASLEAIHCDDPSELR